MVECGVCGGTIVQTWNGRKPAYRCWYNHSRGRAVCANAVVVDMHLADETVLRAITRDVLDPEVVAEALDLALRDLQQLAPGAGRIETLKAEITRLEGELSRYRRSDRRCRTARDHPAGRKRPRAAPGRHPHRVENAGDAATWQAARHLGGPGRVGGVPAELA
jgi:hypothetical protein